MMIARFRNIRAREKRIKDWAKQNKISKGAKIVIIIITIMRFTYVSNLCAVMINYDDDDHHHHVIEIDVFNVCAIMIIMIDSDDDDMMMIIIRSSDWCFQCVGNYDHYD